MGAVLKCREVHAFQDHHGNTLTVTEATLLDESLVIGTQVTQDNGHVDIGTIGVASLASSDAPTGLVTTHHDNSVLASFQSEAGNDQNVVAAGVRTSAIGNTGFAGATQDVTLDGVRSAVIGSRDVTTDPSGFHQGALAAVDVKIIGNDAAAVASRNVPNLQGDQVGVFAFNGSTTGGTFGPDVRRSAIIASVASKITGPARDVLIAGSNGADVGSGVDRGFMGATLNSTIAHDNSVMLATTGRTSLHANTAHVENLTAFGALVEFLNLPTGPTASNRLWRDANGFIRITP